MKPSVSLSGYDPRNGARSDGIRREERRREAHLRLLEHMARKMKQGTRRPDAS